MKDVTHKWKNKTRGGYDVLEVWEPGCQSIYRRELFAILKDGDNIDWYHMTASGRFYVEDKESLADLLPSTKKVTKWVNVFDGGQRRAAFAGNSLYGCEEAARSEARGYVDPLIGTYPIEMEVPCDD
jgi:hypothetical protein